MKFSALLLVSLASIAAAINSRDLIAAVNQNPLIADGSVEPTALAQIAAKTLSNSFPNYNIIVTTFGFLAYGTRVRLSVIFKAPISNTTTAEANLWCHREMK